MDHLPSSCCLLDYVRALTGPTFPSMAEYTPRIGRDIIAEEFLSLNFIHLEIVPLPVTGNGNR